MKNKSFPLFIYVIAFVMLIFSCKKEKSGKEIESFIINDSIGIIQEDQKTVQIVLPYDANLSELTPIIRVSDKATISPASGVITNFINPVTYTVSAEDGSVQQYIVKVSKTKNTESKILSFNLNVTRNQVTNVYYGAIDNAQKTVNVNIPFSRIYFPDLTSDIKISDMASISPISGFPKDFTNPVTYTVKAQNGDSSQYTVWVKNSEGFINSLKVNIPGYPSNVEVDITGPFESGGNFNCYVLSIADLSHVTPEITISPRATITPNVTASDFSSPVSYSVVSESGVELNYTITFNKRSIIIPNDRYDYVFSELTPTYNYTTYDAISEIKKVELVNMSNNEITNCTITQKSPTFNYKGYIFFSPEIMPTDANATYRLKVYLENGEEILTGAKFVL